LSHSTPILALINGPLIAATATPLVDNQASAASSGDIDVFDLLRFLPCSRPAGSELKYLAELANHQDKGGYRELMSPLADLKLALLSLRETPVTDLSPLRSPTLRDSLRELHPLLESCIQGVSLGYVERFFCPEQRDFNTEMVSKTVLAIP
jgi:hypothetical protein